MKMHREASSTALSLLSREEDIGKGAFPMEERCRNERDPEGVCSGYIG
jgi:hypothetical protein